jgi:hypothetical protein
MLLHQHDRAGNPPRSDLAFDEAVDDGELFDRQFCTRLRPERGAAGRRRGRAQKNTKQSDQDCEDACHAGREVIA